MSRNDDLRPEYDFASMKGGVRVRHAIVITDSGHADIGMTQRYLDPDVSDVARVLQDKVWPRASHVA